MKTPAAHAPAAAAQRHLSLNRRQFLRGLGACVALPAFASALRPVARAAAAAPAAGGGLGVTASGAPLRMAFVYFPNGAHQKNWWPEGEGANFQLGKTMEPLAPLQGSVQVLGGLDHKNATAGRLVASVRPWFGSGRKGLRFPYILRRFSSTAVLMRSPRRATSNGFLKASLKP